MKLGWASVLRSAAGMSIAALGIAGYASAAIAERSPQATCSANPTASYGWQFKFVGSVFINNESSSPFLDYSTATFSRGTAPAASAATRDPALNDFYYELFDFNNDSSRSPQFHSSDDYQWVETNAFAADRTELAPQKPYFSYGEPVYVKFTPFFDVVDRDDPGCTEPVKTVPFVSERALQPNGCPKPLTPAECQIIWQG